MNYFPPKKITRRHVLKNTARLCFRAGLVSLFLNGFRIRAFGNPAAEKSSKKGAGFEPAYLELHRNGELKKRADTLWAVMEECRLCPRECGVNRLAGERGICRAPGAELAVSSFNPHFGEERPLVGKGGSGTIFLTHCNLRCVFCQNWEISHLGRGSSSSVRELAEMMLKLQKTGCHNINLVTPTHYSAAIVKAFKTDPGSYVYAAAKFLCSCS